FIKKQINKGAHIADLGCGDGYGSYKLFKEGYRVTGLDLSEDMINRANDRLETEGLSFVQGDLTKLPFQDESFDGLMAVNSLEWTEVPFDGLEEMKRVLKPGGKLCIGILGPTAMPRVNSYRRLFGDEVICNTMMPWELEKMAEETGWAVVDGHGVYKRDVDIGEIDHLPDDLKQALTFMWVFAFQK
ncbi:class I SAM-dependent methyltransferase, partial [Halobacillus sp. BBL2006]|uniref:class I SAM-dependent methyltransferase n=1 Tax=Halobacillus sp. BBL2006 TaxID=1543706 RepID=UPI0005419E0A